MPFIGEKASFMNKMQKALAELSEMDELAAMRSPVHRLHPGAKLITTIAYIMITLSFGKYDLPGLVPMVLWPILLFQISGIEVRTCFYKLRIVLPLVMAVGLFNPFFDLRLGSSLNNGGDFFYNASIGCRFGLRSSKRLAFNFAMGVDNTYTIDSRVSIVFGAGFEF